MLNQIKKLKKTKEKRVPNSGTVLLYSLETSSYRLFCQHLGYISTNISLSFSF